MSYIISDIRDEGEKKYYKKEDKDEQGLSDEGTVGKLITDISYLPADITVPNWLELTEWYTEEE